MGRVSLRETLFVLVALVVAGVVTIIVLAADGGPPTLWRVNLEGPVTAGPALADGHVYAGSEVGAVFALDAATGEQRWRTAIGLTPRGPIEVGPRMVFIRTDEAVIVALHAVDGVEAWRHPVPGGVNAPLLAGEALVVAARSGVVAALDADTGEPRWTTDTGRTLRAAPSLTGADLQTIAAGDIGGRLTRIDLLTGRLLDEVVVGAEIAGPVLQLDEVLIVGSRSAIVALDDEYRERWRVSVSQPTRLPMAAAEGVLYTDVSPDLVAINVESGTLVWRYTSRALAVTFGLGDGLLVAGTHTGEVHGVDLATGERTWRYRTNDSIRATPLVDEVTGVAYFGSLDGWLYAIDLRLGD
jgi:eukaryotic-like serine/threonine-protein kinase